MELKIYIYKKKGRKKKAEDMNNCGTGKIHLIISKTSIVLFTVELKTPCHSESADRFRIGVSKKKELDQS